MKPATAPDIRRRELAQIHIAVQQLGMTDDDHRSLLWSVCQVKSAADLDWTGRKRYLDHLKKLGFKPRSKAGRSSQPRPRTGTQAPSSRPLAQDAESRKIRALWIMLHQLGAVRNPSEESLAAYVKRIAKVDALQWITGEQAETVIETLKKWSMRYLPDQVKSMAQQLATSIKAAEIQVAQEDLINLRSLVGIAQNRQTFDPMQAAWEALKKTIESGGTS
jgi:phage gp16-like protein